MLDKPLHMPWVHAFDRSVRIKESEEHNAEEKFQFNAACSINPADDDEPRVMIDTDRAEGGREGGRRRGVRDWALHEGEGIGIVRSDGGSTAVTGVLACPASFPLIYLSNLFQSYSLSLIFSALSLCLSDPPSMREANWGLFSYLRFA